jgi:RNA polymerase sigma factor (TIGR02999 family)
MPDDSPITQCLHAWNKGSIQGLDDLFPLVYTELWEMSRRLLQGEHQLPTLNPTVIINEVYMRLARLKHVSLENRKPFFSLAAKLMRHVIVDYARAMRSDRRGRGWDRVDLDAAGLIVEQKSVEVLALEDALVRLERHDPFLVKLIEHKVFAGFTEDETAEVLGVPKIRVQREWRVAKRLLAELLGGANA